MLGKCLGKAAEYWEMLRGKKMVVKNWPFIISNEGGNL